MKYAKLYVIVWLIVSVRLAAIGQINNVFPDSGNAIIYQGTSSFRSYDVINSNNFLVSRLEATTDATGQLWLRDAQGNYKIAFRSNSYPSSVDGELIVGKYTTTSTGRNLFVDGTSEFTGKVFGHSSFQLSQGPDDFVAYEVLNKDNIIVSRLESTTDASGQLWLKDALGNYKVAFRTNQNPSSIDGELIVGKYQATSTNRNLFVEGTSEFTGKLYGGSDFEIRQASSGFRAYDVVNRDGVTVSRFEATTDASGQLWLKEALGTTKVIIRSNGDSYFNGGSVGIGSINPSHKLDVNGTIHASEVLVDLNFPGPDYVFEEDYPLSSLSEIEAYIKQNKHLPEVPSAAQMKEEGVNVIEMQMLLLKKVEELTLLLIEQNQKMEKLNIEKNIEIEILQNKVKQLENLVNN
ncbi:hypothetical protein [Fulvivirga sp.]|uniref:hypothetical protein n=1 Tax=Fulvivirga sp. TaxID=1931237 RepID=UPI0032EF07A2